MGGGSAVSVKNAEEVASVSMSGCATGARSAEDVASVSMGGSAISARSVVGQVSVSTDGHAISARNAEDVAYVSYSLSSIHSSPLSFIFGSSIHVFSNSTFFGTRSPLVLALCVEAVGYKLRVWIHVPSTKLCGTHKYQGE